MGSQFLLIPSTSFPSIWLLLKVKVLVTQLCPTLYDPIDCSPPGSTVHGNLQARILEWFAISFFKESSPPRDRTQVSCISRQILYCLSHQGSLSGFYTPLLYIYNYIYIYIYRVCPSHIPIKGEHLCSFTIRKQTSFCFSGPIVHLMDSLKEDSREPHFSQYGARSF